MLNILNVGFDYPNKIKALVDVTWNAPSSGIVSIIGPNGSGKSTLLKLICGLIKPTIGEIRILDQNIYLYNKLQLSKLITYLPQKIQTPFSITVKEFILLGSNDYSLFRIKRNSSSNRIDEIIADFNLEALLKQKLYNLSGGELQKVFIANCLAQETPIVVLDEPSSWLDPNQTSQLFSLLNNAVNKYKILIILSSHDLNSALCHSFQILALSSGRVVFNDFPKNFSSVLDYQKVYGSNLVPTTVVHPEGDLMMFLP